MPGIPREKAVDDQALSSDVICKVCAKILNEPVANTCEHVFCYSCVRKKLQSNEAARKCPQCKASWNAQPEPVSAILTETLASIKYFCPLHCNAEVTASEKEHHVQKECPHTMLPCLNSKKGCKAKVSRRRLNDHMINCHYRKVTCEACNHECLFVELFGHQVRKRCMKLLLQKQYVASLRSHHHALIQYSREMHRDRIDLQQTRINLETDYKKLRPLGYRRIYSNYSKPDSAPVETYHELMSRPATARPASGRSARSTDYPRTCKRCNDVFKPSRNWDKACKYHREPFLNFNNDSCGACGADHENESAEAPPGCLRGFHMPIHATAHRPLDRMTPRPQSVTSKTDEYYQNTAEDNALALPRLGASRGGMRPQSSRTHAKTERAN